VPPPTYTTKSFVEALPRLLEAKGMSLREIARAIDVNHTVLVRMLDGTRPPTPRRVAEISEHLGLPFDYFPEVRVAAVTEAIARHPRLRDEIYFNQLTRKRRPH
jgi:transcriptional regulator with XRE-family HTH domain